MPPNKTEQEAAATPGHVASTDQLGLAVPERGLVARRHDLRASPRVENAVGDYTSVFSCPATFTPPPNVGSPTPPSLTVTRASRASCCGRRSATNARRSSTRNG